MAQITLAQAAAWCGGRVEEKYENLVFNGASNDSRTIQPGQLFVALQGVRDGNEFIPVAFEKGAAAVLTSRPNEVYPAIVVDDPRIALGKIAAALRMKLGMKVVGVTGSVGKSTTKEMVAAVLEGDYVVSKTPANFNNDLGMPMAILAMPEDTQVAVLEMGMSHFGEISYLSRIAAPDMAVITNIGTMHMENLGSREGILQAKLEILDGMAVDAPIFLYGDDAYLKECHRHLAQNVIYFGTENLACQVRAEEVRQQEQLHFAVCSEETRFQVTIPLEGMHYVADALAAISVGLAMDVDPQQMAHRLLHFKNISGRQEIFEAKGVTIINDAYNAGPESMAAALRVLGNRQGRKIAILGDMLELGDCTRDEHYRMGTLVAKNADILLTYGPNASYICAGARDAGMPEEKACSFLDREGLAEKLIQLYAPGDVLLFKGSRGMRMELVMQQFLSQ